MIEHYIRLIELPIAVEGVSVPNNDGSFDIYINSRLSPAMQQAALEHELEHLRREHFYIDLPIDVMERQADGEDTASALHPPEGRIACFASEEALNHWIETICRQKHINLRAQ